MIPSVQNTILDNQLGIRAPADAVLTIIATATDGAVATPANFTQIEDVTDEFTSGPLVECAAYAIERYGLTCRCIRAETVTPGDYDTIDITGVTGTCVPAVDTAQVPVDDQEVVVTIVTGGTIGVTGMTYTYSLDGGVTTHGPFALGTALTLALSGSGAGFLLNPPTNALVAAAVEARADALAHFANVTAHDAADTSAAQVALAASSVPSTNAQAIAVFALIDAAYTSHRANTSAHNSADTTHVVGVAAPTTGQEAITYYAAYKTAYNAHLADAVAHNSADSTNTTAASTPSRGTLAAGDTWSVTTTAPEFDNGALSDALEALRVSNAPWTLLEVYGALDATKLATLQAKLEAMAAGRPRRAVAHARTPDAGESESDYLDSLDGVFNDDAADRVVFCAGAANIDSSIGKRRRYRRPASLAVAPLLCSVSEEVDIAEVAYRLPGVYVRDDNGNPDEHDETINPGLDDARFTVLRTWEGRTGVYVNNPRLFSEAGSDFLYAQHGRVIDVACAIVREELIPILSKGFKAKVDGSGQIDPGDAQLIEGKINGRLSKELVGTRKASAATFALSRTDNVLQTGQISWKTRVVPLVYIKKFVGTTALVASDKAPATVIA